MTQQLPDWLEAIAEEGVTKSELDAADRFGGAWSMNAAQKFGLANLLAQHRRAALAAAAPLIGEHLAGVAYGSLHPHPNHPESDWTEYAHANAAAAKKAANAIRREVNRDDA